MFRVVPALQVLMPAVQMLHIFGQGGATYKTTALALCRFYEYDLRII